MRPVTFPDQISRNHFPLFVYLGYSYITLLYGSSFKAVLIQPIPENRKVPAAYRSCLPTHS